MREILFRAKGPYNKWVYGFYYQAKYMRSDNKLTDYITVPFPNRHNVPSEHHIVDPKTLGQYTGLIDKNGIKIFEGDIVKYGETVHKVVFEQRNGTAYYGLNYSAIETLPFGHYQDLKQIEVIGNIHDNPELLKEDSK